MFEFYFKEKRGGTQINKFPPPLTILIEFILSLQVL